MCSGAEQIRGFPFLSAKINVSCIVRCVVEQSKSEVSHFFLPKLMYRVSCDVRNIYCSIKCIGKCQPENTIENIVNTCLCI